MACATSLDATAGDAPMFCNFRDSSAWGVSCISFGCTEERRNKAQSLGGLKQYSAVSN
jgi:hypothetical protein